jgi:hypothetical protein
MALRTALSANCDLEITTIYGGATHTSRIAEAARQSRSRGCAYRIRAAGRSGAPSIVPSPCPEFADGAGVVANDDNMNTFASLLTARLHGRQPLPHCLGNCPRLLQRG